MPGDWSIDEPQSLFSLPKPLDQLSGCTRAGRVYGFQGSKKRKRTEAAVGVDGECINVYNVKTPQLLTTHALSPQTYLTSSPVCAYQRPNRQRGAQRFTYAATRNDLGGGVRKEILCFQEDCGAGTNWRAQSGKPPLKWTRDLTATDCEVAHIEPLSNGSVGDGTDSHDVLLVFSNGDMTVLSENLQVEKIKGTAKDISAHNATNAEFNTPFSVEFVCVQTPSDAKKGLLKGRPDLFASLDPASAVLLLVTSSKDSTTPKKERQTMHVCSIPRTSSELHAQPVIRPMLSYCMASTSGTEKSSVSKPRYAYDWNYASLYQLDRDVISVYSLSSTTPKVASSFRAARGDYSQLVPVSRSTILVASGNHCALYDSRYGSLQAAQSINQSSLSIPTNLKRKRMIAQSNNITTAIWFTYSSLGIVLGLIGRDIVSFRLAARSNGRKQRNQSQLIDSLGMTRSPSERPTHLAEWDLDVGSDSWLAKLGWGEMLSKLSELSSAQKAEYFDRFFLDLLGSVGHTERPLALRDRDLAMHSIGLIFDWSEEGSVEHRLGHLTRTCIKTAFEPPRALEWLVKHGHLTPRNISKSLIAVSTSVDFPVVTVSEIDIVRAVAAAEANLSLLAALVTSQKLSLSGYVECFRILIRSFDSGELTHSNRALEISPRDHAHKESEEEILVEEDAAAHELQVATAALEHDFDARGSALKTCIERLGTCFSLPETVQALRSQLSQREVMMLVELLRIELEQAGWTSRRLDFHPSFDETESQNEAISVICKLLNCALDAMGTVGWLAERESGEADNVPTLISMLRAETSAVLEGVQESTFFTGFLKDFMHFEAGSAESAARKKWGVRAQARPSMLPLGLKTSQRLSDTRIGAGGEIQTRSARRLGQELSRRVGKYKFEKIRV